MNRIPDFLIKNDKEISVKNKKLPYGENYHSELFFINEKIIFEKRYQDDQLYQTLYYAYSQYEITDILKNEINATIVYEYFENSFKITEYKNHKDGIETDKNVSVENSNGECICFTKYKLVDGQLSQISTETDKNYYETGELKYVFEYNEDGSCFMIHNYQDPQGDIFGWDIGKPDIKFTWEGFEYYKNAEPIIPV
ncbi:hypothetical protein [Flavobacterium macacae]|uniref:Uncharacterized protein n=1 Tax=Flavobacterium macacae TaxID=2488993 RepID=A0A3P3WEU2_9FLAO|nr:hypothetical protein [Flavobacterium macacae]RRJ92887.1 hypothetical protein EG849_04675 [Flavobacterium macacae]